MGALKRLNGHALPLYRAIIAGLVLAAASGAWTGYAKLVKVTETVVQIDRRIEAQIADHQRQLDNHEGRIQRIENWRMGPL